MENTRKLSLGREIPWWGIAILFLGLAVFLNLRMLRFGLNGSIDLKWHLTWLQHFSKQFYEGIGYPRWLAGTNYGYGSPTFVFYPPLVYYLGTFVKLAGLSVDRVLAILFSIALFFGGFFCYLYCNNHWKKSASIIASVLFITAPSLLYIVHLVGSITQVFGMALIPLIFFMTDRSARGTIWKVGLSLSWMLLAFTHLPTLLLTWIFWIFYLLFFRENYSGRNAKQIAVVFGYGLLGLGLASFYLLPAIGEKSWVDIEFMKNQAGGFQQWMIGSNSMPFFPLPKLFNLDRGVYSFFIHQYYSIIFLILTTAVLYFFRKNFSQWKVLIKWLIAILVISFLMTKFSWPIWSLSDTLQTLQSPFRLQSLLVFSASCITCAILHETSTNRKFKIAYYTILAATVLILLINFRMNDLAAKKYPSLYSPGNSKTEHLDFLREIIQNPYADNLRDVGEYRPLNSAGLSPSKPLENQPKVSVLAGKADIDIRDWSSYRRKITVSAKEPSKIRARVYAYPAWKLLINGEPAKMQTLPDSTIEIDLPPGDHEIELVYGWTKYFQIGIVLSFVSALLLLVSAGKPIEKWLT